MAPSAPASGARTAVAAHPLGRARHRCGGTVITIVELRGLVAAECAEHPAAAEPDVPGGVVDQRVAGGQKAGHQPRVVGQRCQQITRPEIAGPDPLFHGTHGGASSAVGPGMSTTSLMVAWSVRDRRRPRRPTASPGNPARSPEIGGWRRLRRRCSYPDKPDGVAAELDDRLAASARRRRGSRQPPPTARRGAAAAGSAVSITLSITAQSLPHHAHGWAHRSAAR